MHIESTTSTHAVPDFFITKKGMMEKLSQLIDQLDEDDQYNFQTFCCDYINGQVIVNDEVDVDYPYTAIPYIQWENPKKNLVSYYVNLYAYVEDAEEHRHVHTALTTNDINEFGNWLWKFRKSFD